MEKAEFSETQFVLGYTKEVFGTIGRPFNIYAPSTSEEKQLASDLIIKHYNIDRRYRFSEFYQFKRSKYYNSETFDSLKGGITIDTSITPKYGFNIYNSKKTKQFNVLQKLGKKPRCRVFYCAPMFHTINEYNNYFGANNIMNNSKVFSFSTDQMQKIRILLGSNHQIVFDRASQHLCSDPIVIDGFIASERNEYFREQTDGSDSSFESTVSSVHQLVTTEIIGSQISREFIVPPINYLEVREMLITYFDIYWILNTY